MTDAAHDLLRQFRPRRGHFALESGHHGDLRFDVDRAFDTPRALGRFVDELARRVVELDPDIICGPLTGGAFLAFTVAERLSPFGRPSPTSAGTALSSTPPLR